MKSASTTKCTGNSNPRSLGIKLRKCVACQARRHKSELVRIVKKQDSEPVLDLTGKASGRGAYLCPNEDCMRLALGKNALQRSLRCNISNELRSRIEEVIAFRTNCSD